MDIPFTVPQVWVPLAVGLLVLGLGSWLVSTKNLLVRLLGLVLALGGVSLALTPLPNDWISPGIKFVIVIVVFIGLSAEIAKSGWKSSRGATITGGVLTLIGVLALIVQIKSYVSVPTGSLQQAVSEGFGSLSRILSLAGKQMG
jgi:hypothetical protein